MTDNAKIIDEIRGELDKEHGQEPGFSGPITDAYMRGYGRHPRLTEQDKSAGYREAHCEHGWYT